MGSSEGRHMSDDSDSLASLDSTGKQKSFVRVMTRFAEKTSMQGVPYINNAKLLLAKVIWSLLLIAAMGMMGLHLWYLCDQFFQYPKVTKITLGFNTLRLPAVTLCNTNHIHMGRLGQFNGAESLKALVEDLKPENLVPDQFDADYDPTNPGKGSNQEAGGSGDATRNRPPSTKKRRKRFIGETDTIQLSQYDPDLVDRDNGRKFKEDEFDGNVDQNTIIHETFESLYMDINKQDRMYLGHNISDMLLSCTFAGRTCTSDLFRLTQNVDYGNCWTIDSDKFTSQVSGPEGGLSLSMFLETTDYLEGITHGYGLRLLIHQPHTFPFPKAEGNHISASFETNVGLKLISIEREEEPYGDCDPEISDDFATQFNLTYTARACRTVCYLEAMVGRCGCFHLESEELAMRKNRTLKPCRSAEERRCKDIVLTEIGRQEVPCYCPVSCRFVQTGPNNLIIPHATNLHGMVLLESVCEKQPTVCKVIRDKIDDKRAISYNFLKLNIYYEDLNFENIKEEPEIETAQFVSDVGGAVGLWIGLSLLSVCEIFQLVMELCHYAYYYISKDDREARRRHRRNTNRRQVEGSARHRYDNDSYPDKESNNRRPDTTFNERDKTSSPREGRGPLHERWGRKEENQYNDLYEQNRDLSYPLSRIY